MGLAACIGVVLFALATTLHWRGTTGLPSARIATPAGELGVSGTPRAADATASAAAVEPTRPIYRYSIVPGGVQSAQEVARVVAIDPVVAAHYAGLDIENLRAERLAQPLVAHVSYRVGSAVFWTKRRLRLAAGETVLTDGKTLLRARCGNIISTVRRTPIFAGEPEEAVFDLVTNPIALASDQDALVVRHALPTPRTPPGRTPRAEVPGPGAHALAVLGLAATLAGYLWRRRTRR